MLIPNVKKWLIEKGAYWNSKKYNLRKPGTVRMEVYLLRARESRRGWVI